MQNTGIHLIDFLKKNPPGLILAICIVIITTFISPPSTAQLNSEMAQDPSEIRLTNIPESAKLLSGYLQIESVTGNEGNAGRYLLDQCLRNGLHVRVFSDRDDQFNFAASLYPLDLGLPNIIFLNHIDVVPPGNVENWNYGPFSGMISDGMIHGRGAIDMKGMAIMQLSAISEFALEHRNDLLQFNVTLLSVSGEEDFGTLGAGWVVEEFLGELNPMVVYGEGGAGVRGIISGDPERPVMCISIADKKALWLELQINEPSSGHGSVPPLHYSNKTALQVLSRILERKPRIILDDYNKSTLKELAGIEGGIRGFMLKNISVLKPFISGKLRKDPLVMSTLSNTVTLTNIFNPAGSANQIAQETTASLDCRLLPGFPVQKFLSKIRKSASNENATVRIIHQSQDAGPSELKDHYYRLSESLKKAYPECEIIPILFPATTDNNYFRKYDIPTYGINPVCFDKEILKTIHNEDERISIDNLEKGIMVYYDILQSALKDQMNLLTRKADLLNYSAK